jgi:hypothetical protein
MKPLVTSVILAVIMALAGSVSAADQPLSNAPPRDVLLLNGLGQVVKVPINEIPARLVHSTAAGLKEQIPTPTEGAS